MLKRTIRIGESVTITDTKTGETEDLVLNDVTPSYIVINNKRRLPRHGYPILGDGCYVPLELNFKSVSLAFDALAHILIKHNQ